MLARLPAVFRRLPLNPGFLLVLPALILVGVLFVVPLLRLTGISFGGDELSLRHYYELFSAWSYGDILLRTLRLSSIVVAVCLLFGYPIAYVLAFSTPRCRVALSLLVLLPFWTSALVRNFAWIYLLRDGGVISSLAGAVSGSESPLPLMYNEAGVVIGMVSTLLPFMVFPVFLAIAGQDRILREAAASLGAAPVRMFLSVTWPLSRSGVVAGSILVFVVAAGFFITPALLGGGRVLMTATFITQQVEEFVNWPLAAAAGVMLLLVVLILLALFRRVSGATAIGSNHAIN